MSLTSNTASSYRVPYRVPQAPALATHSVHTVPPALRLQGTLLGGTSPQISNATVHRTQLDTDSWIDHGSQWLTGSDTLMANLWDSLSWQAGRRPMFDHMVDVPRLSAFPDLADEKLPPVVVHAARWLQDRYGLVFDHLGANLYRSGRDSVAWHGDRVGRRIKNPMVAVLSLGGARPFLLRPKGGGPSLRVLLHPGDLLVMGGACQHRWEHAVPKVHRAQPRISLTFRHD